MVDQRLTALVIGSAKCVWDDLYVSSLLFDPDITIAVNKIGVVYIGNIDHWVSYHADLLSKWSTLRKQAGLSPVKNFWSGLATSRHEPRDVKRHANRGGSSGLLATCIALDELQASKVVLAGIPIDPTMGHFDNVNKAWRDGKNYQTHWIQKKNYFNDRVRSMSGWTSELLGKPTIDWLKG